MKIELTDDEHSILLEVLGYSLDDNYNCLADLDEDHNANSEIQEHCDKIEELIKKIEGVNNECK